MSKVKIAEVDIAKPVVDWLQQQQWEVYKEVTGTSGRADIVAVRHLTNGSLLVWVVEVKTSASLTLLEQAVGWLKYAHYVSIATPVLRECNQIVEMTCKREGIGHFEVKGGGDHWKVTKVSYPSLHRDRHRVSQLWKGKLFEAQKLSTAGNNKNEYWSKYRETCLRLTTYVREHQGCSLKEAIEHTKTHYASTQSARSALKDLLQKDVVHGIRAEFEGKLIKLYTK